MKFEGNLTIDNGESIDIFPTTKKESFRIITIGCNRFGLYVEYENKNYYLNKVYELIDESIEPIKPSKKKNEDFHNDLSKIGVKAWNGKKPTKKEATRMCNIIEKIYNKWSSQFKG